MRGTAKAPSRRSTTATFTELRMRFGIAAAIVAVIVLALPSFASANPLGEVSLFNTGLRSTGFNTTDTADPEGNVWFVDNREPTGIGRVTPEGAITEYISGTNLSGLNAEARLSGITVGPDEKLWVTDYNGTPPGIAVIDPASPETAVEYSTGLNVGSMPQGIVAGPDGNLWFADGGATPAIGVFNPTTHEVVKECSAGLNVESQPHGIVAGPDGNLWFTDTGATRAIGKIDPSTCAIEEFATGDGSEPGFNQYTGPYAIATGPDGNVWFSENGGNETNGKAICRITPSGTITCFKEGLGTTLGTLGLTTAADGKLWFADQSGVNEKQTITFSGATEGQKFKVCNGASCGEFEYKVVTTSGKRTELRNRVKAAYETAYGAGTVETPGGGTTSCGGNCALTVTFSELGALAATNVAKATCEPNGGTGTCTTGTTEEGVPNAVGSITTSGTINLYPIDGLQSLFGATYAGGNVWLTSGAGSASKIVKLGIEPSVQTVTVTRTGTGSGTVTSEPSGINCGSECSKEITIGESFEYTLTESPAAGSRFVGWLGCNSEAEGKCKVKGTGITTVDVKAEFEAVQPLTVSKLGAGSGTVESSPSGINCGGTCTAEFKEGSTVTLSQSAAAGSEFRGWGGACSGTGTCEVTMSAAKEVSARFANEKRLLTVEKAGAGDGSVKAKPYAINCATNCGTSKARLYKGTLVTLTAKAGKTSTFGGWSGCDSEEEGKCIVTMSSAKAITATFNGSAKIIPEAQTLTLSKAGDGAGTVKSKPGGIACEAACTETEAKFAGTLTVPKPKAATTVLLTATPAAGSTLSGFSGCDSINEEGQCVVAMSEAKAVTATFAALPKNVLTLAKAGLGDGTVKAKPYAVNCATNCPSSEALLASDTKVILTEKPGGASSFGGWSGCDSEVEGKCLVTMSSAKAITATFNGTAKIIPEAQTLTLSKAGDGAGTVKSKPGGIGCEANCTETEAKFAGTLTVPKPKAATTVLLTATAAAGSTLTGWSGCDSINEEGQCVVSMSEAKAVTATFDQ